MKISTITNAGVELLNGSLSNFTALRFQSLVIGSGSIGSLNEAKELTTVKNYKTKVSIETIDNVDGIVKIESIISNKFVNPGYVIREIGLIALDDKDNEVMIWYINYDDEAGYLPAETSGSANVKVTLNISLSDLGFIEVDYVADLFASKEFVNHNFYNKIQVDDLLANFKGGVDIGPGEKQAYSGASGLKLETEKYDDATIDGNKLKLMANGEVKKILTLPVTGGGGGGATLLKLTKVNNPTVASFGSNLELEFEFTSVDPTTSQPTGDGSCTLNINGKRIGSTTISQGISKLEIGKYLIEGLNTVNITVMDDYGSSRSLVYEIEVMTIEVRSSFDNNQIFEDTITYRYTPIGSLNKTIHFELNGIEIYSIDTTIHNREMEYIIPKQKHGVHRLEVYLTADVNGTFVRSKSLINELICSERGNGTTLIALHEYPTNIKQYESTLIRYRVYDPTHSSSEVSILVNDTVVSSITVNRTIQTFSRRIDNAGNVNIKLISNSAVREINVSVEESSFNVEAETNGLHLYLTANGRNNSESSKDIWENNGVRANMTGFNWSTNGWMLDKNNNTVLRVNGSARVEIPFKPFADDFRRTGRTIEIEFASSNVEDVDTVIMSCFDTKGFRITPQSILFKSELSTLSTYYKEDERVRVSMVVQKSNSDRLLFLYLNGEISAVYQYPNEDSFTQSNPLTIKIEGLKSTIDIYNIRIYNNDLNQYQLLNNFIADMDDLDRKINLYNTNQVYNASGDLDFNRLLDFIPIMTFVGALPQFKGDKKKCKIEYTDKKNPENSFTALSVTNDVQGTSSQYYPRKNYKFKFDKTQGVVMTETLEKKSNYPLRPDSIEVNCFCLKADFAESSGTHNTGMARLLHDMLIEMDILTPPQIAQKEKENKVNIRTTIDGFPILVFHKETADSIPSFLGKYNFNNDKSTEITFGFNTNTYPRCQSIEFLNNNSDRVTFNRSDYDEMIVDEKGNEYAAWIDDFEFRFPDDDVLNEEFESGIRKPDDFKRLTDWILSVKNDPVRFKTELPQYFHVKSLIFYHCMTELFGMVDQRAKNMFATTWDGMIWWFIFYDNDTVLGLDNNGIIKFGTGIEYFDKQGDLPIWNDKALSALWVNVENTMKNEIGAMYNDIRKLISYEKVVDYLNTEQSDKWCESIYNEDSRFKYIEPLTKGVFDQVTGEWKKTGEYLERAQGSREEHRKWWMYNRFRYMDSKYNTGDYTADYITMRVNVPTLKENPTTPEEIESNRLIELTLNAVPSDPSFELVTSIDQYLTVKYENTVVRKRTTKDTKTRLEAPSGFIFTDTNTIVYGASKMLDFGDISSKYPSYLTLGNATKVTTLKVGSNIEGYRNPNLRDLYLGNNTMLRNLDIRNCVNLEKPIDLSGCVVIENFYASNTKIPMVVLPNGGSIKTLHLPSSLVNLTLVNQESLEELKIDSYESIQVLRLEASKGSNLNLAKILKDTLASATNLSKLRVLGLKAGDDISIEELDKIADTMKGIDENGFDIPDAVLEGTLSITVDSLDGIDTEKYKTKFPNLRIIWVDLSWFITTDVTINGVDGKKIELAEGKVISGSISLPDRFGKIIEIGNFSNQSSLTELIFPSSATIMKINKNSYQGTGVTSIRIDKHIVHMDISDSNITHINNTSRDNTVIFDTYDNLETLNIKNTNLSVELINCNNLKTIEYISNVAKKIKLVNCPNVEFTSEVINDYSLLDLHIENCPKYNCFGSLVHRNNNIGSISKLHLDNISGNYFMSSIPEWLSIEDNSKITLKGNITLEHSVNISESDKTMYQNKYPLLVIEWVEYLPKIGWVVETTRDSEVISIIVNISGSDEKYKKVDWGDGKVETVSNVTDISHVYSKKGIYTIKFISARLGKTYLFQSDAGKVIDVYIDDGVERFSDEFFKNCSKLTTITIPDSVTSIGTSCFYNCSKLTSITIPDSVTSIGTTCFYNCSSLTSVVLSKNLTSISSSCFYNCSKLTSITIPDSVTSIDTSCFYGCSSLTTITIPDSVTSIGSSCFYNCSSLTSVVLSKNLTSIGTDCFSYCSSLTNITIPDSVTSISDRCFRACSSLTSVVLSKNLTSIGTSCFYRCSSLTTITIPNSVTSIGTECFYDCSSLTNITIPDSVTSISNYCFRGCSKLTNITIPDSITSIGNYCFSVCSSLTSVTLSKNLSSMESYCFNGCTKLTSIIIPDSVTSMGDYCFSNCSSLTSVVIPNTVTRMGRSCFDGCTSLTSVTIPNSVTSISDYCFSGCSSLTSVTIPNGVTSMGRSCFDGCTSLTSVVIPDSVTSIGIYCFKSCSSLTSVTLSKTLSSMGNGCFSNCSSLTSIVIPDSVTSMIDYCFDGCTKLTSVTLSKTLSSMGGYCFKSCSSLTSIVIPDTVTRMGDGCFKSCSSLTSIVIPDSVTRIDDYCFYECAKLYYIKLSNNARIGGSVLYSSLPTSLDISADTPPSISTSQYSTYMYIHTPKDKTELYKNTTGWSNFSAKIKDSDSILFIPKTNIGSNGVLEITVVTSGPGATVNLQDGLGDQVCSVGSNTFSRNVVSADKITIELRNANVVTDVSINNVDYAKKLEYVLVGPAIDHVPKNILRFIGSYTRFSIQEGVTYLGSTNIEEDAGNIVDNTVTTLNTITLPTTLKFVSKGFLDISTLTTITTTNLIPPAISATPIDSVRDITLHVPHSVLDLYKASNWATAVTTIVGF